MRKRKKGKEIEAARLIFLRLLLAVNLREWIAIENIRDLMQSENMEKQIINWKQHVNRIAYLYNFKGREMWEDPVLRLLNIVICL